MTAAQFKKTIWDYYKEHGRHNLPWRHTRDPYRILVSEVMLQQTQVGRVEGYYAAFIKRFPDFGTLARARTGVVLRAWQGLGYNRRALLLKKLAEAVVRDFHGTLPREREVLESLPGIGPGTSGAVRAFAFNEPETFIETNIRRVFLHSFFKNRKMVTDQELVRYIKRTLDKKNPRKWYWALMDYGAAMPAMKKEANPNRRSAHYAKQSVFVGSDRELRGKILRLVLDKKKVPAASLATVLSFPAARIKKISSALCREGFIERKGSYFCINH